MRQVDFARNAEFLTRPGMVAWWFRSHAERDCGDPTRACQCACPDHRCADATVATAGAPVRCPACRDSGFQRVRTTDIDDLRFGRALLCSACNTGVDEDAYVERIDRAGIPAYLWHYGQWQCIDQTYSREPRAGAQAWAQGGHADKPFLVLTGNVGTGKTAAAVAAAHDLLRAGFSARYVHTSTLLDELRATYRRDRDRDWDGDGDAKRTADAILAPLMKVGVLILDELGGEKASEWTEERLTTLINDRLTNRARTIITTNVSPAAAPGTRLWSRVFGDRHAYIVFTAGPDRRKAAPR